MILNGPGAWKCYTDKKTESDYPTMYLHSEQTSMMLAGSQGLSVQAPAAGWCIKFSHCHFLLAKMLDLTQANSCPPPQEGWCLKVALTIYPSLSEGPGLP